MEQVAAEARAQSADLGSIQRCIDGKGVVIFFAGERRHHQRNGRCARQDGAPEVRSD
ncbi:hypothetical protein [Bilophila wadsworthia]|uniref:hypothetical protein n=1 Tax=Bilophila wadsworthia TaxID=35833 RepID=UPI001EDC1735|nr:hypothetical protein [Bilophila wadsworthia]